MARPLAVLATALVVIGCQTGPIPSAAGTSDPSGPTPPASRTIAPSPSPTSTAPPPSLTAHWEPLAQIESHEDIYGIVAFDDGYVVADGFNRPLVHVSPDGREWSEIRLDPEGSLADLTLAITSDSDQVLVVGAASPCQDPLFEDEEAEDGEEGIRPGCGTRPRSWITDDGREWRASEPVDRHPNDDAGFELAWSLPSGGWEAAAYRTFDLNDETFVPQSLWASDDGTSWSMIRDEQEEPSFARVLTGADDQRVAIPFSGCSELWGSTDGRTYERLPRTFDGCDEYGVGLGLDHGAPWIVFAVRDTTDLTNLGTVALSTGDLAAWTESPILGTGRGDLSASVNAVARFDGGYVATGSDDAAALTWLSTDGATWWLSEARPIVDDPETDMSGPSDIRGIATGPAGTLGIGCSDSECGTTMVWRLVVDPNRRENGRTTSRRRSG